MTPAFPLDEYATYARLRAEGFRRVDIDACLRSGSLVRVRRGRYVAGGLDADVERAARLGGRLDCVSLLRRYGVFALEREVLHIQLTVGDSRLPARDEGVVGHWRVSDVPRERLCVGVIEALTQACICQPPRAAIATLDSAWNRGLVDEAGIAEIFRRLPRRMRRLRGLIDRRAESGPETYVRLMLRALGCAIEPQVRIGGVGRVDFVVDGWLIVECDSREFHSSWEVQREDRRRDMAAAAIGYATLRLLAEDILYRPDVVIAALRGLLAARNSSRTGPAAPPRRSAGRS
ncbi:endonuclease domain-containing protein [Microbacterium sp. NPDC091313]